MLTTEQLQKIMPQLTAARLATFFPFLSDAIDEFAIDQPPRAAAFIAQLAHESGQLRFMEEIWGPTAAQRRYEPPSKLADVLGNTEAGDGKRFKGRGPIQITGRANYRRYGDLLGVDLIVDPPRAALPDVAFRIAGLYWSKKGLNELADQVTREAFREITRRINGGFNGLADRERFYETAKEVLGVVAPAVSPELAPGPAKALEPAFDRGQEAIRSDAARRRKPTRKKKPAKRRVKKVSVKKSRTTRVGSKRQARSATRKRRRSTRS